MDRAPRLGTPTGVVLLFASGIMPAWLGVVVGLLILTGPELRAWLELVHRVAWAWTRDSPDDDRDDERRR